MGSIILNGLTPEEFKRLIGEAIEEKLFAKAQVKEEARNGFITRSEVKQLLKISYPTLNIWTKAGWLKAYKMGNRVYYKLQEVEQALTDLSNKKHRKGI
jgi:excisionase family DNA binding protein